MTITTHNLKCLISQLDDEFFSYSEDVKEKESRIDELEKQVEKLTEEKEELLAKVAELEPITGFNE